MLRVIQSYDLMRGMGSDYAHSWYAFEWAQVFRIYKANYRLIGLWVQRYLIKDGVYKLS